MTSIKLTKEQKEKLINDLATYGKASIHGVVDFKFSIREMKGREFIDENNPLKGFRITDVNVKSPIVSSIVTEHFKRKVKLRKKS